MTSSEQSDSLQPGDRVQVYNPGPLAVGTVRGEPVGGRVAVRWDDGERGYPRVDLLRKIEGSRS